MKIRFHVSAEQAQSLSIEEYETIERARDGAVRMYQLRPVLARFMVDEEGKPVEHEQAMKTIGALPASEIGNLMTAMSDALSEAAVPKGSGN